MAKLTEKQKRFCDEYLIDLNATQAAIRAGYKERTAGRIGSENLKKLEIKKYIDQRMQEIKSQRTADAEEVLETLTAVMRGEVREEIPMLCGEGCQKLVEKSTAVKERLKAAELLGKRYRLFEEDGSKRDAGAIADFLKALHPKPEDITALYERDDGKEEQ